MTALRETLAEHVTCGERYCETLSGPSRLATCDYCRERVAAAERDVLAWVGARLAGARESVTDSLEDERTWSPLGVTSAADAALTVLRDALGVPVAPAGGEVAPGAAGDEIGPQVGAEGCAACPFVGCVGCQAEAANRAMLEAK